MTDVSSNHIKWLESITGKTVSSTSHIQSLWNNYGACFRATFKGEASSYVIKCVDPKPADDHPRGWHGEESHKRKIHSFHVERHFYNKLQSYTDEHCKTPQVFFTDTHDDATLLVMEDLHSLGYTQTTLNLSVSQVKVILNWLAAFHGRFISLKDTNVWQQGNYWHLSTREREWHSMAPSRLKSCAKAIDEQLKNAPFKTLVHGDAKVANFCFNEDYTQCAAVDFQYTGFGVGVIDVAYFLGSALSVQDLLDHTDSCLECYLSALNTALASQLDQNARHQLITSWRQLYPFACADFNRFLSGWSPGHWKINEALILQTTRALRQLK